MNKIFIDGNYLIIEEGGTQYEYAANKTVYTRRLNPTDTFTIVENGVDRTAAGRKNIPAADITSGLWFEEDGTTRFTIASLTTFLRNNTGFKTASGSSGAIGAKVLKTNQTVSYRTGDDGDLQAGRELDFYTLSSNNPFGNTNRFTDELGGQTFTNDIVLDWSTYDGNEVLGYYRSLFLTKIWNTHIDDCLALSVGSFTSGWRMINRKEAENIHDTTIPLNTPNLYFPAIGTLATSTTYVFSTGQIWCMQNAGGWLGLSKAGTFNTFAVRDFTVNGTTIT